MIRIQSYILWITAQWYGLLLSVMLLFAIAVQYFQSLNVIGDNEVQQGFMLLFTFLRVPLVFIDLLPIALFLGTLFAMQQLSRSYEAVSIRAAGLSFWRMSAFPMLIALALGAFVMLVLQPLAVHWERVAQKKLNEQLNNVFTPVLNEQILWTVENFDDGIVIIHAQEQQEGQAFENVRMFRFDDELNVFDRIDAERMSLEAQQSKLENVTRYVPKLPAQTSAQVDMPFVPKLLQRSTNATLAEELSFWQLPQAIQQLEQRGKNSKRFVVAYHRLLSLPLFYVLAIMLAYAVVGISPRRANYGRQIAIGFTSVLGLYIAAEMISAFAATGLLPVTLAVWGLIVASLLLLLRLLLRREDG